MQQSKTLNYILLGVGILLLGAAAYLLYKQSEDDKLLAELKDEIGSRTDMLNEASDRLKAVEAVLEKNKPRATTMNIVSPPDKPRNTPPVKPPKRTVTSTTKTNQKPAEKAPEKQD